MPFAIWVPVSQFVPPTRTLNAPFSSACHVIVELSSGPIVPGSVESIVTVGAWVSTVNVESAENRLCPPSPSACTCQQ